MNPENTALSLTQLLSQREIDRKTIEVAAIDEIIRWLDMCLVDFKSDPYKFYNDVFAGDYFLDSQSSLDIIYALADQNESAETSAKLIAFKVHELVPPGVRLTLESESTSLGTYMCLELLDTDNVIPSDYEPTI